MGKIIYVLQMWEFDNLENRDGLVLKWEKVFDDIGKLNTFLKIQRPELYSGWDNNVYPMYVLKESRIHE